jgi:hypothetical protein
MSTFDFSLKIHRTMARFVAGWWSWRVPWLPCLAIIDSSSPTINRPCSGFRDNTWRVGSVYAWQGFFAVLMFRTMVTCRTRDYRQQEGPRNDHYPPLNQTRQISPHESRTHSKNSFTRPPIFSIATSTFWASTSSPTSLAFRWLPSTSATLSLWRVEPTFDALPVA